MFKAESELAKLERQFRILDRDGRAYNRQAREQIHRQRWGSTTWTRHFQIWLRARFLCSHRLFGWCDDRQDIEKLQKEQEELHRNLGIFKNLSRLHRDSEDTKTLRALLEEEDMIHAALLKEKEHQQELDREVNHSWFSIFGPEAPS